MTAMLTSCLCHAQITPGPQFLSSILLKIVSPSCVWSPLGQLDSLQKCPVGTHLDLPSIKRSTTWHFNMLTNSGPGHNHHPSIAPIMSDLSATAPHKLKLVFLTPWGGKVLHGNAQTSAAGLLAQGQLWVHAEAGGHPRLLDFVNELSSGMPLDLLSLSSSEVLPPLLNRCVLLGTLLNTTAKGHRSTESMFVHPTVAGVFPATVNLPSTLAMSTSKLLSLSSTPLCQVYLWILKTYRDQQSRLHPNFDWWRCQDTTQ